MDVELIYGIRLGQTPWNVGYVDSSTFLRSYGRKDGLMATYHPDFIVATADRIYLIETKGDDKVDDANVRQKQSATIEWVKKVNALLPADRMNRTWEYVLVGESVFYALSGSGATISDICNRCKVSYAMATGDLFE